MKMNKLFSGLVVLGILLLSGCRESLTPLPAAGGFREGGRRLGSELSIVPTENAQRTKSSYTGDVAAVSNWTLFQFDAATGLLEASYYQPSSADLTKIKIVTDRVYDWYAVANVGDVRDRFVVGSTPASTLESWYASGFDMTSASGIPMAWMGKGLSFSKADLSAGRKLGVAMTRLVARYDITVDKSALTRYSFTVTGATIEGPDGVRPFAESRGTGVAVTTDVATAADIARMNSGDAATFYAAENLYGEKAIANADSKKPKNLGADDHPTFIEIAGNATLLDGSGLTFGTTYRFYLGTNATTNFDVLRNTENTVTLYLTDAKIEAAIDERDVISGGGAPEDPLWKVEVDPYSDTRSLRFQHGVASGGTGIRLSSGTNTAEAIVKDPAALQYQFRLDQALYDAGVRVFRDGAGSSAVLPGSGYAEDIWVSVTDSPATLYFYIPAGVSDIGGQAHIRTLDGRKSDDLNIAAGRVLDHLEVQFGTVQGINTNASPNSISSWGSRYVAAVDTILIQNMNNASYANGFGLRVYAVYTDGSEQLLSSDSQTQPGYSWATLSMSGTRSGVSKGYAAGSNYFFNKLKETVEYRLVRTAHSGTSTVRLSYAENGVTRSIDFITRVHVGLLKTVPASTASARIGVGMNGSVDLGYWWVDNNDKDSVNVTARVSPNLSVSAGADCLRYDGVVGGKARFSGRGVTGNAQATVAGNGYVSHADVVSLFGENPAKVRAATLPSAAGINSGNFDAFRYAYFTLLDDRVLDHLTLDPVKTYVMASGSYYSYTLTAHFTDGSAQDITSRSDVTWTDGKKVRYRNTYNQGFEYWLSARGGSNAIVDGKKTFNHYANDITANYQVNPYASYPQITATTPQALFTASWTFNGVTKSVDELGVVTRDAASLAISPAVQTAYTGGKPVNFTATVTYTDGSTENVTNAAAWNNDTAGLLTNNGRGTYTTGTMPGTTMVTASFGGVTSNTATVTVTERTPATVQLQMWNASASTWQTTNQTVGVGSDQQWRLHVTFTDGGAAEDVTTGFTLTSSNTAVLSVSGCATHAAATGSSSVRATFRGMQSTNSVQVTVEDHAYTYEFFVSNLDVSHSYAEIAADAAETLSLNWNGYGVFYAYHVRKDHGSLDASYGTGGVRDVSAEATWTVSSALTATDVGSWNVSSRVYDANNQSGSAKTGSVTAQWNGHSDSKNVSVDYYEAPYLYIEEAGPLTWNCWEYGPSDKKTFHVKSNTSWVLTGATDEWYLSKTSGTGSATITVYPKAKNTGDDNDVTITVTGSWNASLTDFIVLMQDGYTGRGANKLWYSLELSPASKTIAVGETWSRFTATLVSYSDKDRTAEFMRNDISDICRYEVSDPAVASVKSITYASSTGEATGLAAGTVTVTGWWMFSSSTPMTYREGVPVEIPGTATLTVTTGVVPSLSVSSNTLQWAWDESGSASGWSVVVTATNCSWSIKQISNDFGYSTNGNVITVYPKAQNASTTTDKTGTLVLQGTNGVADVTISLTQTKKPETPPEPATLQVSPTALAWTWDESGSSDGKTAIVTATNCTWAVKSCTSTFGYSVSGNTITVYPKAQNTSTTADKTGTLTLQGSDGASDVTVSLTQTKKPAPVLTSISFDRDHYDLVQVVDGTVSLTQSFRVTALFSDGSTADITSAATYADQGSVSVSAASGTMTAQSACTSKVVTASYGGLTGQATYSATDLEVPVGLVGIHFESQEDQTHEFVIHAFEATLRRVLSGATRTEEVTVDVSILSGPIVRDPDVDGMLLFHFSSTGSGTIAFSHTRNGVTFTCYLDVTCYDDLHIDHTWR